VTAYLSLEQLIKLHEALAGRSAGLRDRGALESALGRPAMTFGGDDLYPDLAAKAAALMHSLVLNHPFVDGNKRTGVAAAELFVRLNQHSLVASDDELLELTVAVAEGKVEVEALAIWWRQRLRAQEP